MINIFDASNTNFDGNGDAVLLPIECKHTQVAAGKYDLRITCPIDKGGKWMHIVPEAIIRAPVPEETIENAYAGLEADLYQTNTSAAMRSGTSEPTAIVYSAFDATHEYHVGDKCTYTSTATHQNYQLKKAYDTAQAPNPVIYGQYWSKIANSTSGSPVLVNLRAGASLYFVADAGSGWYKMSTTYGLEGYIKSSQVTFIKHLTPEETQPRTITTQLFRVKTVNVETKNNRISATAEHVSNDLKGVMVENAQMSMTTAAMTIARIESGMLIDYRGTIATNMTSDTDGTYSGQIRWKNALYAILDPDKGVVGTFGAAYRRDNWDLFIMRMNSENRGFRLQYRKNMLGVSWNIRSDKLVTRVIPVAKAADGGELYLDGTIWVDSPYINNYPVIRMEQIRVPGQVGKDDGTETGTNWTTGTLRAEMQKQAQNRFSVDKADQIQHDITIDFEMLGDTEEYSWLKGLETALMYDTVTAINEEIQLSVTVQVTEIEYDAIRQKITAMKLSNVEAYNNRNVTGFNVFSNSITPDKLTKDVGDEIVEEAVDVAVPEAVEEANSYTRSHTKNYVGTYEAKFDNYDESIRDWVTKHFKPVDPS